MYCEDPDLPSVANELADMIVDYELAQKIQIEDDSDFEVDDEIVTEEEFLRIIDQELDEHASSASNSESIENKKESYLNSEDQSSDNLNDMKAIHEDQTQAVCEKSNLQVENIMGNLEKVVVAPGEFGGFENWGKDVFLIEKCFPEKLQFGTGGSCMNDPENDMGFANYCINQIMSCDSKFRNDSVLSPTSERIDPTQKM